MSIFGMLFLCWFVPVSIPLDTFPSVVNDSHWITLSFQENLCLLVQAERKKDKSPTTAHVIRRAKRPRIWCSFLHCAFLAGFCIAVWTQKNCFFFPSLQRFLLSPIKSRGFSLLPPVVIWHLAAVWLYRQRRGEMVTRGSNPRFFGLFWCISLNRFVGHRLQFLLASLASKGDRRFKLPPFAAALSSLLTCIVLRQKHGLHA